MGISLPVRRFVTRYTVVKVQSEFQHINQNNTVTLQIFRNVLSVFVVYWSNWGVFATYYL